MAPTQRKKYSKEDIETALSEIRKGSSAYKIARKYGIPRSTLHDKMIKKYTGVKPGRPTVLKAEEEKLLVDWVSILGDRGFPVTKKQLMINVEKLVKKLHPNDTRFKGGKPGDNWYTGFMGIHKTLSKRVSQNLTRTRAKVSLSAITAWFCKVEKYFEENDIMEILNEPTRLFNCDETAFFLCPKEKNVLVRRGSKCVYNRTSNDEKECLTVLATVAASGVVAPPMILFPYKRGLPANIPPTIPKGWGLGYSESGWMTHATFYEYVSNVFYPWLISQEVTLPVVLFLDGHTSHISLELNEFCREKNIILIALLPNATHIVQPLDVAAFHPIKEAWKNVVHQFKLENEYSKIKRTDFGGLVKKCFDEALKPNTIRNGFRACGIYPFGVENMDTTKIVSDNCKQDVKDKHAQNTRTPNYDDNNTSPNAALNIDKDRFREMFEKNLPADILCKFHSVTSYEDLNLEYKQLYVFWKSLYDVQPREVYALDHENDLTEDDPHLTTSDHIRCEGPEVQSNLCLPKQATETRRQSKSPIIGSNHDHVTMEVVVDIHSRPRAEEKVLLVNDNTAMYVENYIPIPPMHTIQSVCPNIPSTKSQGENEKDAEYFITTALEDIHQQHVQNIGKEQSLPTSEPVSQNYDNITILTSTEPRDYEIVDNLEVLHINTNQIQTYQDNINDEIVLDANLNMSSLLNAADISINENIWLAADTEDTSVMAPNSDINEPIDLSNKTEKTDTRHSDDYITPKKSFPTPFKNVLYFPKKICLSEDKRKKATRKLVPVVATSDEFVEYQRREKIEKENKEKLKNLRALNRQNKKTDVKKAVKKICKPTLPNPIDQTLAICKNTKSKKIKTRRPPQEESAQKKILVGEWVVVKYEGEFFPGLVITVNQNCAFVKTMHMYGEHWKWPQAEDILSYTNENIMAKINPPLPIKPDVFNVPEITAMRKNK